MRYKHKAIVLLVIIMLMAAMLAGCVNRDNNNDLPQERSQPGERDDLSPPLPGGGPGDPNWIPPEYPDGSVG